MSVEEVMNPGVRPFRGFGHPPETPHYEVSVDPTMQRMVSELNAEMGAKSLRTEAEMNTPEGRKKAAKMAEAELAEKRRSWEARAWAYPLDGFVGIPDSAEDKELKIYTRTYDLQHKYWGIKPVGMTIWDFWEMHDPEVTRYSDANQETPASPETSMTPLPPTDPPQQVKAAPNPRKLQKTPEVNPTHRIRKSTTKSSQQTKNHRKSLAHKVDTGNLRLDDQMPEASSVTAQANGRQARDKGAAASSGTQEQTAKAKSAMQDNKSASLKRPRGRPSTKIKPAANADTIPSKRPRGRPPAKRKSNETPSRHKKTPAVKGNAKVTKSSQSERRRPSAPSTHKMRTRREGPAELLHLP